MKKGCSNFVEICGRQVFVVLLKNQVAGPSGIRAQVITGNRRLLSHTYQLSVSDHRPLFPDSLELAHHI